MRAAWKFLAPGRVAPFGGHTWPGPVDGRPGEWLRPPGRWVYACRVSDLPFWIQAELWELELEGPLRHLPTQVAATSGRLLRRVPGWDAEAPGEYGAACAQRACERMARVLDAEGRGEDASRLRAAEGMVALCRVARELSTEARTRYSANLVAYVAEAALRASEGVGAAAANIAAYAAVASRGEPSAYAVEREWQARWIAVRAGLPEP